MNENEKNNQTKEGAGANAPSQVKKTWRYVIVAVAACVLALGFFFIGWFSRYAAVDPRLRRLGWLIDTLDNHYYEDVDIDGLYDEMYDKVVPDKFSHFYTADEYAVVVAESKGSNSNFGFSITASGTPMRVTSVIGNSSADRAGLKAGMYLYRFGSTTEDLRAGDNAALTEFLRGKKDTPVLFECGFTEEDKQPYALVSGTYAASYCSYADSEGSYAFRGEKSLSLTRVGEGMQGLPSDTAYIRLAQFTGNAAGEFSVCMRTFHENGKHNLVLDLRHNGGGALSVLQNIASYFTKNSTAKKPVALTAQYNGGKIATFYCTDNLYRGYFDEGSKITVLADEGSASASECLIGAMLDYGAINYSDIYLRVCDDGLAHTYGKGVMQTTYVSSSGDAFRLTSAKIFWPVSGKNIHGEGNGIHERDGAVRVEAPYYPSATDEFLTKVLAAL